MQQYIRQICVKCGGVGKIAPPAPANIHSEEYAAYQRGVRPAPRRCVRCSGVGMFNRINPLWLINVRTKKGLTRKTFALQTGRTYMYIAGVENGYIACTEAVLNQYLKIA